MLLLAVYAVLQAFLGGVPIDEAHIEPLLETSCISAYQDTLLKCCMDSNVKIAFVGGYVIHRYRATNTASLGRPLKNFPIPFKLFVTTLCEGWFDTFLMSSRKNLRQISLLPNLFRIFAF